MSVSGQSSIAAAPVTPAPIGFTVDSASANYREGTVPRLSAHVTNRGAAACGLASTSDLTVAVVAATRDGQPLVPSYTTASPVDGATAAVVKHTSSVAPGAALAFDLDTSASELAASIGLDDGSMMVAQWPLQASGRYQLQFAYALPPATFGAACAGVSDTATVTFTIGQSRTTPWLLIAVIAVVVIAVIVVLLFLRRRSRRRNVAATAAVVVLLAVTGAVAIEGMIPAPAYAGVTYGPDPSANPQIYNTYMGCITAIAGFDPGLLTALNNVNVTVFPWLDTYTKKSKKTGNILIGWEWDDHTPFVNEPSGAANDPCSSLYHELNHARDMAEGSDTNQECDDTGVPVDEVRATLAENKFRASRKPPLPQRTTYDGKKIPPTMDGCTPPKVHKGERWAGNDPPICRGLDGPCGSHTGDPHLGTFDGYRYDLQAVGEFVAVHSSADDMDIQVRQAAYGTNRYVAIDTAVAMKVAGTKLGFYLDGGVLQVHRDGAAAEFPAGTTSLPGDAKLNRISDPVRGDSYAVVWPDSSAAWVSQAGRWGLSLAVQPRAARVGTITGTLGRFDGDPANDLSNADGTVVAQPPTFEQLYHTYANSWRVTDSTSLFDYAAGTNTKTFTDLTFPDKPVTADTLPPAVRDSARAACTLLGISDPIALADCILDVANTGQASFAVDAQRIQVINPSRGSGTAGPVQNATVTTGGKATFSFTGTAGQHAYVEVTATSLPNGCYLSLIAPNGTSFGLGCIGGGKGQIDSTKLPATGEYHVVVGPSPASGTVSLRVSVSTDAVAAITPNGPPATATTTAAGQFASLTFSATAGTKVFVDITATNLPFGCSTFSLAAVDGPTTALGCTGVDGTGLIDTTTLTAGGNYALVLHAPGAQVGSATIRVTTVTDQQQTIVVDGSSVSGTVTQPGARSSMTFTAAPGDKVFVDIAASTLPWGCSTFSLAAVDGPTVSRGCTGVDGTGFIDTTKLANTGIYTVVLDPPSRGTGSATIRVIAVHDQQQTISINGPSVLATVAGPGGLSVLTFSATAGQKLTLDVTGASAALNGCGIVGIADAAGHIVDFGCIKPDGTGSEGPYTVPTTGTYAILVDPQGRTTGSMTLRLHT
jgi:hypothetical protein